MSYFVKRLHENNLFQQSDKDLGAEGKNSFPVDGVCWINKILVQQLR